MISAFFNSKRWALWAWGGLALLLGSVYYQVTLTVWINQWYGGFYDLLQQGGKIDPVEGVAQFWGFIKAFCWLAFPYIGVACVTNWFTRLYALRWREAITFDYIPRWLRTHINVEGASQRIQEDCAKWAEIIQGLGLQMVRSVLTLIAFIPVLWVLSRGIKLPYVGELPGSLVWAALAVSIGGMVVSWFVGWFLPHLEYNNQKTEAAFRKELVYGEDDRKYAGLKDLGSLFTGVRLNHERLYRHYGYFDLWVYMFDQFMSIAPYIVAGPMLIEGVITLGVMIQVSNAFGKVQNSLSMFIHNWTVITSARSVWKRLHEFESKI
jgi:peptide/bleomycin uptake transporter